ncbi:tyrosine-type recombinase/integrase [Peribacillus sp. JNUCC 23]
MCLFWYKDGILPTNPTANIKRVNSDHLDEVPGLADAEVDRSLSSYDERQFAQWRDKTLCLLLLDSGMRIQEAVNLKIDHIGVKRCVIYIPSEVARCPLVERSRKGWLNCTKKDALRRS